MSEKRILYRHKKRLTLKFGAEEPVRVAFTEDISNLGIFIRTTNVLPVGSPVKVELALSDTSSAVFEGVIRWSKRIPPHLAHLVKKGGMGVLITKFISGEDDYEEVLNEMRMRNIRADHPSV